MSSTFTNQSHRSPSSPAVLGLLFTPLPVQCDSPLPAATVDNSSPSQSSTSVASIPPRRRSRASTSTGSSTPPAPRTTRGARTRYRSSSTGSQLYMSSSHTQSTSASSNVNGHITPRTRSPGPGSPPPYSVTPPNDSSSQFLKRAASSPHLRSPPNSPSSLLLYPYSNTTSRRPSSSALNSQYRSRYGYSQGPPDTSDDPDTDTSLSEDTIVYTSSHPSLAGTLRARIFGKGKGRADESERIRPITTAPGIIGAGETETEGEDYPRHLPTARITPSTTNIPFLASLSSDPTTHLPTPPRTLIPLLFELSRLLSIVPAVFGTLYNVYHVFFPPQGSEWWRVEYFLSALWAVLTGWQCLQLTTGLLKRWRVYYTPLPTLIRLCALQAICWPATRLTLLLLEHEKRPLICWAIIGTTTCCSRSIQMWVTSNIIVSPSHHHHHHHHQNPTPLSSNPCLVHQRRERERERERERDGTLQRRDSLSLIGTEKERMKMGRRRKWDWGAVGAKCASPAGLLYFVMAWAEVLRREWEAGRC